MGFKIPKKYSQFEPEVSFNGEKVNLNEIPDRSITIDFYKETEIRGNTPGQNELVKKFNNETLVCKIKEQILPYCSMHDDVTYDGALQLIYVPELLKRIEELQNENERLKRGIDNVIYDLANEDISDLYTIEAIKENLVALYKGIENK